MVWQDGFSGTGAGGRTDPEEEREARLAAQVRAGAEWALAALVARYQPPVARYLTRLTGDPAAARHSAEQIFVRMERRVRGPQGGHNLRLWLLRAATEAGLEYLRTPATKQGKPQLEQPRPAGLLPGTSSAAQRLKASLGSLAARTGTTGRQVHALIFPAPPASTPSSSSGKHRRPQPLLPPVPGDPGSGDVEGATAANEADPYGAFDPQLDTQDARTELHHHLVRAVLSELPYGDAQCLALHLVAGLNQAQVARALGITPSAARRRIVQGLQLFAQRYEAATAGLPPEVLAEPETPEVEDELADVPTVVLDHPLSWPASDEELASSEPTPAPIADEPSEPDEPEPLIVEEEPEPIAAAPAPEPRPEIVVDATPPAAGAPLWPDPPDIAPTADPFVFDTPAAKTPAPPDARAAASASSLANAIWPSARRVPALTPIALPAPQIPADSAAPADTLDARDTLSASLSDDHANTEGSGMPATDEAPLPHAPAALPLPRQVPVLTEAAKAESATQATPAAAPWVERDSGLPRADGHQADSRQDDQDGHQTPRYVPVLSGDGEDADEGVAALSVAHAPGDERSGGTV
jgi:RNA polymerase sigma factor (sigma-70 family)